MENRDEPTRISVGTVHDWQKLKANYREAVLQSFQAALNTAHHPERDAMLAYIDEFIERTFNYTQPNLRINGNTFEALDENGREMEPFDEALDRRIWSLADTRLQWHKRIAEARRTIPKEIETNLSALIERHRELDSTSLEIAEDDIDEPIAEEDSNQHAIILDTVRKTAAVSNELNQTVSRQKERGERIREVDLEVKSLKL